MENNDELQEKVLDTISYMNGDKLAEKVVEYLNVDVMMQHYDYFDVKAWIIANAEKYDLHVKEMGE